MDEPRHVPGAFPEVPSPQVATDALISESGGLVFLTTGAAACEVLNEAPVQVALTPMIALRLAEILKGTLQYGDRETRRSLVEDWAAGERLTVPYAVLEMTDFGLRIGIEPLGAGSTVPVLWEHVPGLTLQLADAARRLRGPA